jgi:hypothetical protein
METIENKWTALQINVLEKGPGAVIWVCHTAVVSKFSYVLCRSFLCDSFSFLFLSRFSQNFEKRLSVGQHGTTLLTLDGFDEI